MTLPWFFRKLLQDRVQRLEDRIGDTAERLAGFFRVRRMAQDLCADLELAVAGPEPCQIEHVLKSCAWVRASLSSARSWSLQGRFEEILAEHGVELARFAAEGKRGPARCSDLASRSSSVGLAAGKRAGRLPGREELVELGERAVQIDGLAED